MEDDIELRCADCLQAAPVGMRHVCPADVRSAKAAEKQLRLIEQRILPAIDNMTRTVADGVADLGRIIQHIDEERRVWELMRSSEGVNYDLVADRVRRAREFVRLVRDVR